MSSYPGEHTNIPKHLAESLQYQPLNHLVPKTEISALLHSTFSWTVKVNNDVMETSPSLPLNESVSFQLSSPSNSAEDPLKFKRIKLQGMDKESSSTDIFEGLSALAKSMLPHTGTVNSDLVVANAIPHSQKHARDQEITEDVQLMASKKRTKVTADISLTQLSFAEQYLIDLNSLLKILGDNKISATGADPQHWLTLNGELLLSENCLKNLIKALKNTITIPGLLQKVDVKNLQMILSRCADNIFTVLHNFENRSYNTLKIASDSAVVIFIIFSMDIQDRSLYLERYISLPIRFINLIVDELKEEDLDVLNQTQSMNLLLPIGHLLPQYLKRGHALDEGLITKLIYIFSDLIVFSVSDVNTNICTQNNCEKLKSISSDGLYMIFRRFTDQQTFIVDELLSHLNMLPTTRSQKKLKKVSDTCRVSHLTYALVSMLQTVNSYDGLFRFDENYENTFEDFLKHHENQQHSISTLIEHINDAILKKCFSNVSKERYILECYVQDLIALVSLPNWSITEIMLASLLKKMLAVFTPAHQESANIEGLVLSIAGNIGSTIQDISLKTQGNEVNNLIKVFNKPERLPALMSTFHKCLSRLNADDPDDSQFGFLWHKQISMLLSLIGFDPDSERWTAIVNENILKVLQGTPDQYTFSNCKTSNSNELGADLDYLSSLHVFELVNLYEPYTKLIISLLNRPKIKLRSGAIKCLSLLASKDATLLKMPSVKETIELRLQDSSASVKDAILELLSLDKSYLDFYRQINLNFNDESTLVRRHVLKLNLSIYDDSNDVMVKAFVANRILRRTEDEEDSIIEMARTALLNRWFLDIEKMDETSDSQEQLQKSIQVISTMVSLSEKAFELFDRFLNFYVLNKYAHHREELTKIIISMKKLTDKIVEMSVSFQSENEEDRKEDHDISHTLQILSLITACDDCFITKDHIAALYPYIASPVKSNWECYILRVFKNSFSKLSNFKPKFLYDLETSILGHLTKMNARELEEAIPLSWLIAKHRKDSTRISKACSSCLIHLTPYINQATKDPKLVQADGKLQKLIYLASGFSRYCQLENKESIFPNLKTREPIFEYVTKCLILLTREGIHSNIKRIAVKNLVRIAVTFPKLFNSRHVLKVLDYEFEQGTVEMKLALIETLYDFFLSEEQKSLKITEGNGATTSSSLASLKDKLKISKLGIGNDTICSALVSRYLKDILKICLYDQPDVSFRALRYLKLILEYGYTNPTHCLPSLIALVSSKHLVVRTLALSILKNMLDKHESMIFNSLVPGIRLAIESIREINTDSLREHAHFLSRLQELFSAGKKATSKFIRSVRKAFDTYFSHISDRSKTLKDGVLFMSLNMVQMHFEDQLQLYSFVKVLDSRCEQLEDTITDTLREGQNQNQSDNQNLSNLIIARLSLLDLRSFYFQRFSLSEEKLSVIGTTEENELKSKSLGYNQDYSKSTEFFSFDITAEPKELLANYLSASDLI